MALLAVSTCLSSKATLQICLLSVSGMASPHTQTACSEHGLSVGEESKANGLKLLKRSQWLRAAILGANDGLLSTTSLMLGVGAAKDDQRSMLLSGFAGAVAGACSMAVGEYVSVSTQRDIEVKSKTLFLSGSKTDRGDIKVDIANPSSVNLTASPVRTPLRSVLCKRVNELDQSLEIISPIETTENNSTLVRNSPVSVYSPKSPLMKVMDTDSKLTKSEKETETKMETESLPNPYKAAAASALSFLFGSFFPLVPAMLVKNDTSRVLVIIVVTSIALALFGGVGAFLGGSTIKVSAIRVLLGGWISMAITYGLLKPLDRDSKGHDSD